MDTIEYPLFCIEVKRYDAPRETWRFFMFESETNALKPDMFNVPEPRDLSDYIWHPFGLTSPRYAQTGREQVTASDAEYRRALLDAFFFQAKRLEDVDEDFAHWIIHHHCPIEFHSVLDARDQEWTKRVTIWVPSQAWRF